MTWRDGWTAPSPTSTACWRPDFAHRRQEPRLRRLAAYIDKRIADLSATQGQIGDTRLLLMAALLIADELSDAYDEMKRLRGQTGEGGGAVAEDQAAAAVEQVAERIEHLATRLEAS
jgi:cell division protein ZapA